VYDKLIASTEFKGIHNLKTYKLFCFSNIFPPSIVKSGELRYLLISSPNIDLIRSVFSHLKENLVNYEVINIGEQQYCIRSLELLETIVAAEKCVIRTSTPVSIRIPEKAYQLYNVDAEYRKEKFLYWRSNLSHDMFLKAILNNIRSKYKFFYKTDIINIEQTIQSFILLKEVVIHLDIGKYTAKVPASFWRFHFGNLDKEKRDVLNFALDTGIGERNSVGLGFLNVEEGGTITTLARV
jgi:CRISPR-associated endoribonuclease Cas6